MSWRKGRRGYEKKEITARNEPMTGSKRREGVSQTAIWIIGCHGPSTPWPARRGRHGSSGWKRRGLTLRDRGDESQVPGVPGMK
jgi:hypothetical protein